MITVAQAERVHALLVAEFGGATGLRDPGGLEACLARPYQTFGGTDLIPTATGKAAAMLESVIIRHPWLDGNKRTGFLAMLAVLDEADIVLTAQKDEIYSLVIDVSTGSKRFEEIVEWLKKNTKAAG